MLGEDPADLANRGDHPIGDAPGPDLDEHRRHRLAPDFGRDLVGDSRVGNSRRPALSEPAYRITEWSFP